MLDGASLYNVSNPPVTMAPTKPASHPTLEPAYHTVRHPTCGLADRRSRRRPTFFAPAASLTAACECSASPQLEQFRCIYHSQERAVTCEPFLRTFLQAHPPHGPMTEVTGLVRHGAGGVTEGKVK